MAECPEEGGLWVNLVCFASHLKVNTFDSKLSCLLGDHLFGLSLNHVEGWRLGRFAHSHFLPPKHQLQGQDRLSCHTNLSHENSIKEKYNFFDNVFIIHLNPALQAGKVLLREELEEGKGFN